METMEEQQALVQKKGFRRFASFFRQKKFDDRSFQGATMGAVICLASNEVAAHMMLRTSAELAEIPAFSNDVFLITLSILECLLAPFLCWAGHTRRPHTMAAWVSAAGLATVPMFFLGWGAIPWDTADLCNAVPAPRSSDSLVYARVICMAAMGFAATLGRASVFAHGVAMLDDFDPKNTVKDLGIIIGARTLVLTLGGDALSDLMRKQFYLQVVILALPPLINGVMLCRFPRQVPVFQEEGLHARTIGGTGFIQTISRIFRNGPAVTHILSAGFLSAGAWGFALFGKDFVRAKHLMAFAPSQAANQADAFRMCAVIMMVVIIGYQLATPTARQFDKLTAVKKTISMAVVALVAVTVMTLMKCDSATVEGLGQSDLVYRQPGASLNCGCDKGYNKMFPVCSLSNRKTYLSPCHAGCERRVDFHGTSMLTSCRSSNPSGDAFEGICNGHSCFGIYSLHQIMFVGFLTAAVISIVMHCMLVLRSVDARDKSTALGVTSSAVAALAFVGGHLLYTGISSWTCAFNENGFCHLHNWQFQYALSGVTAAFIVISIAINIWSLVVLKRRLR